MRDWSRRNLLLALGAVGTVSGGWYLTERPHCLPRTGPRWTYHGDYWGPVVPTERGTFVPEGYGVTGGRQYRLVSLDTYHGEARWATVTEGGGFGVPTVHGDAVYVGTGDDEVCALNVETGERLWTYDAGGVEEYGGGAWAPPLATDERVYAAISHSMNEHPNPSDASEYTHRMVALDPSDGTELWATTVTDQTWTRPVHVADAAVSGSRDGILRGFDPETGAVRWESNLPGGLRRPIAVDDETLTLVTDDGTAVFVDVPDGTTRRTAKHLRGATAFARDGDTVYVGGESGRVVALSTTPAMAEWPVRWEYEAGVEVGAIAAGEEGVFVVDQSGHLHRVSDEGRREKRRRLVENPYNNRCGLVPGHENVVAAVLDDRWLYVSLDHRVHQFSVGDL